MKAKQRAASCSALHMGDGSCISDDSPHRSAYLPKFLSNRRIDQTVIPNVPLPDDGDLRATLKNASRPLRRSSSLVSEPDEIVVEEIKFLEDYELPLKGVKRSKKKSKRRKDSKKKHHGKSDKDKFHYDLHLADCDVQTPMSALSMDDWFEDMYEAQLSHSSLQASHSSLLGNLPSEDDLTAAFLDAGVHIAEHKTISLTELKEEVRESENASAESASKASLVGKKSKKKKSKAHVELELTPPGDQIAEHKNKSLSELKEEVRERENASAESTRTLVSKKTKRKKSKARTELALTPPHSPQRRPCFSSPGDIQLDGRRSQFLDSTTGTSPWQNPLKKASPDRIALYESSSEWQSRQKIRSEWSDFLKCNRKSKSHPSTPTIDVGPAREANPVAPFSDPSRRMSQRQHAVEGMGRHSRRASMGNHSSASDKKHSTPRRTTSLVGNEDKTAQPFELGLNPSEIEQRRKILQRTIQMSTRHLCSK